VNVGATGFPASGIMGTGLEIALAPADAFGFLMREILDKIDAYSPFFGYVSIRVCSMTNTLMGMQQFGDAKNPYSVMIEVMAFATPNCLAFIHGLPGRLRGLHPQPPATGGQVRGHRGRGAGLDGCPRR